MTWSGATEVARDERVSIAECEAHEPGRYVVRAELDAAASGAGTRGEMVTHTTVLTVLPTPVDQIRIEPIQVVASEPTNVDEIMTHEEVLAYLSTGSIAAVRRTGDGRYRTSVGKPVTLSVEVEPKAFGPLIEWRANGAPMQLGATFSHGFMTVGTRVLEVGPPSLNNRVELETYSVNIVSHQGGKDYIRNGETTTFRAETRPRGLEEEVTWLAGTKHGSASPAVGRGKAFTVRFANTWGQDPENGKPFQWLGVRADNALFAQDQIAVPVITSFSPTTVSTDNTLIVMGDNFPLNPANLSLVFMVQGSSFVPVLGLSVTDLDSDGFGERIMERSGLFAMNSWAYRSRW